jgi:hypothetical protein
MSGRPRRFSRAAKLTAGFALLPVGMALLVLPGPGLPVVACSLMLLESVVQWAGQARQRMAHLARRGAGWIARSPR